MKINCEYCGKEFNKRPFDIKRTNHNFCSRTCSDKQFKGRGSPLWKKTKISCEYCKVKFYKVLSQIQIGNHNFCSQKCHYAWRKTIIGNKHPLYKRIQVNCTFCNKSIMKHPYRLKEYKHHFCNRVCKSKWISKYLSGKNSKCYNKIEVKCSNCDKIIERHPYFIKKCNDSLCSPKCFSEWFSKKMSGPTNPFWFNGKSFEPYTPDFNNAFKESIRKRDNYHCMVCDASQEQLDTKLGIHHVDYNKLNSFKENCISLCKQCHTNTNIKNRNQWTKYFKSLLNEKYGYEYIEEQKIIYDFVNNQIRQEA